MRSIRILAAVALGLTAFLGGTAPAEAVEAAPASAPCIFWFICC